MASYAACFNAARLPSEPSTPTTTRLTSTDMSLSVSVIRLSAGPFPCGPFPGARPIRAVGWPRDRLLSLTLGALLTTL
ncbi:hypothetical protein GCM10010442_58670 [Kitasatospora kifunensis]